MNKILSLLVIFILSSHIGLSQGGANYTIYGLGEIIPAQGAIYNALGGAQVATPQKKGINVKNPAMWSYNVDTRIQLGYGFNQSLSSQEHSSGTEDLYQNFGGLEGIFAVFSIDTSLGLSAGLGLGSYSNVNYFFSDPIQIEKDGLQVTGKTLYEGSGGLSQFYFGGSVEIIDRVSFGATIGAIFGSNIQESTTILNEENSFRTNTTEKNNFKATLIRTGLAFEPVDNLILGTSLELVQSAKADKNTTYNENFQSDIVKDTTNHFELDPRISFGASYRTGKFLITGDYTMQDFKNFDYNHTINTTYNEYSHLGFGVERAGNTSRSADYLDKITYRLGFSMQNYYFDVNNEELTETAFSFGGSLPLTSKAKMDVSFVLGTRGTTDNGLIKEQFGRMVINLSIGETWFKPFKREFED